MSTTFSQLCLNGSDSLSMETAKSSSGKDTRQRGSNRSSLPSFSTWTHVDPDVHGKPITDGPFVSTGDTVATTLTVSGSSSNHRTGRRKEAWFRNEREAHLSTKAGSTPKRIHVAKGSTNIRIDSDLNSKISSRSRTSGKHSSIVAIRTGRGGPIPVGARFSSSGSKPATQCSSSIKTYVVSVRGKKLAEWLKVPDHVYIGRANRFVGVPESIWHNPFHISKYGREGCIKKFEEYLMASPELLARVGELRGKVLGCWCAPLACHGHVLARLAEAISVDVLGSDLVELQGRKD